MTEKHNRSIVKAFSWRLTGTLDTVLISFLITGDMKIAASIGGIEVFSKILLYYFHERAWNKINFGKHNKEPEYNI